MQVLGIDGSEAPAVASRVASHLDGRGDVAVVRVGDVDAADRTVYTLDDGDWQATGGTASLVDVLDRIAADHDYAVVEGFPTARIPHLAVGDVQVADTAVHRVASPDALDLDDLAAWLDGVEPYESLSSLVARVKRSADAEFAGAITTFTGRVRARDGGGDDPTERLEFEKYEGVADRRMRAIEEELARRDGVLSVVMHHRTGVIEYGEDIVFVVVLAGHRDEAFRTVEDGINRLKDEVPIFKKEITVGEEFWVHTRE